MQVLADTSQSEPAMRCEICLYFSARGRCQRIFSRYYSKEIADPKTFGCARWEKKLASQKREAK